MGGASRRGSSEDREEKRTDSYSKQFRKQFKVNKKTGEVWEVGTQSNYLRRLKEK